MIFVLSRQVGFESERLPSLCQSRLLSHTRQAKRTFNRLNVNSRQRKVRGKKMGKIVL